MRFVVTTIMLAALALCDSHAAGQLRDPESPFPKPIQETAATTLTPEALASASLSEVNRRLWAEYSRLATEAHRKSMEGVKLAPGSCGGVIGVMAIPSVLPIDDWRRLSNRCTAQLAATDLQSRMEALQFAAHLQQIAATAAYAELLTPELRAAVARLTADADTSVSILAVQMQASFAPIGSPPDDAAYRTVLDAAASSDSKVRRAAVSALSTMTAPSKPEINAFGDLAPLAIERLLPLTEDSDRTTRFTTVTILARTGEHTSDLMPKFSEWLASNDWKRRSSVYLSIEWLGVRAKPLVATLIAIASDSNNPDQSRAIRAIGYLRTAAAPAIERLTILADHIDEEVSSSARFSLARLGPVAWSAAPALRRIAEKRPQIANDCTWTAEVIEGKRAMTDPTQ